MLVKQTFEIETCLMPEGELQFVGYVTWFPSCSLQPKQTSCTGAGQLRWMPKLVSAGALLPTLRACWRQHWAACLAMPACLPAGRPRRWLSQLTMLTVSIRPCKWCEKREGGPGLDGAEHRWPFERLKTAGISFGKCLPIWANYKLLMILYAVNYIWFVNQKFNPLISTCL